MGRSAEASLYKANQLALETPREVFFEEHGKFENIKDYFDRKGL